MTFDINNLTIGQAREIAEIFSGCPRAEPKTTKGLDAMVGVPCIIRTYSAGVWYGTILEKDGSEVIVSNARRMWRWKAAESISLSAVAIHGIVEDQSRIAEAVGSVWLEAIELIPCTVKAQKSIEGAENVKAR